MNLTKQDIKKIRGLILFTAAVCLGVIYINTIIGILVQTLHIFMPFLIGGCIAFLLNIPMRALECHLFSKIKNKYMIKFKRPVCIMLSIIFIIFILVVVVGTVAPQLTTTIAQLAEQIPVFFTQLTERVEDLFSNNPEIVAELEKLQSIELNWKEMVLNTVNFLKGGVGSVVNSTFSIASGIVNGFVSFFISFIFAIYILSQKEKLGSQVRSLLAAFLPEKQERQTLKVMALLNQNFSNFITGQCLEAVILGAMFFICMKLFQFPYALLVGVLIAFTALIPIVGAFIGCAVGTFLILIDSPIKALWFLILFLILQQIEGNLIYPHVVGNSVGLPSIWVLVAVSVGGSVMGITGMLIFIPLVSTVYTLLRECVHKRREEKQQRKIKT